MSDMKPYCEKCNHPINWKRIKWDYKCVPGYKVRRYECKCGNCPMRLVPTTEKTRNRYKTVFSYFNSDKGGFK